jgi:hypothetical protein
MRAARWDYDGAAETYMIWFPSLHGSSDPRIEPDLEPYAPPTFQDFMLKGHPGGLRGFLPENIKDKAP